MFSSMAANPLFLPWAVVGIGLGNSFSRINLAISNVLDPVFMCKTIRHLLNFGSCASPYV